MGAGVLACGLARLFACLWPCSMVVCTMTSRIPAWFRYQVFGFVLFLVVCVFRPPRSRRFSRFIHDFTVRLQVGRSACSRSGMQILERSRGTVALPAPALEWQLGHRYKAFFQQRWGGVVRVFLFFSASHPACSSPTSVNVGPLSR